MSAYLETLRERWSLASVRLELAGICKAHELAGADSPRYSREVRSWLRGAARRNRRATKKARPLTWLEVWKMVDSLEASATGPRDRALILVGFAAGLRESELVAIDREDLEPSGAEYLLRIRGSKTDPTRRGLTAGIPRLSNPACCPVVALEAYLELEGIQSGPVFRGAFRGGRLRATRLSVAHVDLVLRRVARLARIPVEGLSGHSLRRGIATAANDVGCTLQEIADCMRHRSLTTALGYVGDRNALRSHVLRKIAGG